MQEKKSGKDCKSLTMFRKLPIKSKKRIEDIITLLFYGYKGMITLHCIDGMIGEMINEP